MASTCKCIWEARSDISKIENFYGITVFFFHWLS